MRIRNLPYLNLGCGRRFHPEWTNVDFTETGEGVIAHNLTKDIPCDNESFDVIYHSHLLEHFTKTQARRLIQECYRVLKPGNTLRVVIPDLEQITKAYIHALEHIRIDSTKWEDHHNWLTIELLDQLVRNHSGGEMATYLYQEYIPNEVFILKRLGTEAKNLISADRNARKTAPFQDPWLKRTFRPAYHFLRNPNYRREILLNSSSAQ